jgi:hypothetical protein
LVCRKIRFTNCEYAPHQKGLLDEGDTYPNARGDRSSPSFGRQTGLGGAPVRCGPGPIADWAFQVLSFAGSRVRASASGSRRRAWFELGGGPEERRGDGAFDRRGRPRTPHAHRPKAACPRRLDAPRSPLAPRPSGTPCPVFFDFHLDPGPWFRPDPRH